MNTTTLLGSLALAGLFTILAGCGGQPADGPPAVQIGDTLCDECNMIISDDRFVTSAIIDSPRGAEARLFDDFICQVNYESERPDLRVLGRWSRNYNTSEWLETETAVFVMSPQLRTPMASQAAAVETMDEAERLQATVEGDIVHFETAWTRLKRADGSRSQGEATPESSTPTTPEQDSPKPNG